MDLSSVALTESSVHGHVYDDPRTTRFTYLVSRDNGFTQGRHLQLLPTRMDGTWGQAQSNILEQGGICIEAFFASRVL